MGGVLISAFSVRPLRSLCLCGEALLGIFPPQRHRERKGRTENFKSARHRENGSSWLNAQH
jgi:hypothetical protein